MSFSADARRARDASLPLGVRYLALRSCVAHTPVGYQAAFEALRREVGVQDRRWSDEQILDGVAVLEQWRADWRDIDSRWQDLTRRRRRDGAPVGPADRAAYDVERGAIGPGFPDNRPSYDQRQVALPSSDSFDAVFADHLAAVRSILPAPIHEQAGTFDVRLDGWVTVPIRMYHPEPRPMALRSLSPLEKTMLHCLYTRHHDGFVRQRHLREILPVELDLVVPYVVRLIGEYVVEIVADIRAGLPALDHPGSVQHDLYREFADRNQAFIDLTWARAESYWSCYYRDDYLGPVPMTRNTTRHLVPERYPAFPLLDALRGV